MPTEKEKKQQKKQLEKHIKNSLIGAIILKAEHKGGQFSNLYTLTLSTGITIDVMLPREFFM
jgi:hypothetical protein